VEEEEGCFAATTVGVILNVPKPDDGCELETFTSKYLYVSTVVKKA
jgi:hypothetical protein